MPERMIDVEEALERVVATFVNKGVSYETISAALELQLDAVNEAIAQEE